MSTEPREPQHVLMVWVGSEYPRRQVPLHPDTRYVPHPSCVELWPECETFGYDPRCCRFPKSCSAGEPLICPWPAPDPATRGVAGSTNQEPDNG